MFIAIFAGILFLDIIFLPALGFYDSSLVLLFPISVILYYGINKKTVYFGFFAFLFFEFLAGYSPGQYSLSFMAAVLILFLASRAFNINPGKNSSFFPAYIGLSIIGVILIYLLSFIFILISGYILGSLSFNAVRLSWLPLLYFAEVLLLLLCLNFLKKNTKYL